MRKWQYFRILACGVAVYILLVALASFIGRNYVFGKADKLLEFAVEDFKSTLDDTLNYILSFAAYSLEEELETARPFSKEELFGYVRTHNVDEINIADTNGLWIASTDDGIVGSSLDLLPETAEYRRLLELNTQRVYQPFRASAADPSKMRKYIGLPFVDGSGLIQVGLDKSRVLTDCGRFLYGFMDDWNIGDQRFYLLVDGRTGEVIVYDEKRLSKKLIGRRLLDLGFPCNTISELLAPQTGHVVLDGMPCRFRMETLSPCILVALIPDREFYGIRFLVVAMPALMLGFVLIFFLMMFRVQRKSRYAELRLRAERRRQRRQERQRQAADLQLARNIQRSSLPSVFPPYPRDLTIDLFADMIPARDVGGDFYDFFYTGTGRLAVLIADVSGKGVPAAMFMMKAKSILRELVLSMSDLGEALAVANERLCEGNEADMFVTCWIGVFTEGTGVLHYVNAGHNPPYLCRDDGPLKPLDKVSGMFLGGMEGIRYKTFTERLSPGDLLFLYTDGVTEANNVMGEMFGESRLEEVLQGRRGLGLAHFMPGLGGKASPAKLCHRVRGAVDAFAGKAAQFDDITLLALRYRGVPRHWVLELPATLESVPAFNAFAEEHLVSVGCPQAEKADLLVALDEISNNVAQYSGSEKMRVEMEFATDPSVVRFSVSDTGKPWNPLEHLDPDITLSADAREIGGLGILMVKKLMDDVSYANIGGRNVLRFRKMFQTKMTLNLTVRR